VVTSSDLCPVDTAANEQDPIKRIAYVAAFAMSNYSSTIGRIAKPFNPMLVESSSRILQTGSVRIRLTCLIRGRLLNMLGWTENIATFQSKSVTIPQSRRVGRTLPGGTIMERYERLYQSGHLIPSYLLKVDAKNKFAGKSFEIKPTGQYGDGCDAINC
jgi:Oxysterol-binding protein